MLGRYYTFAYIYNIIVDNIIIKFIEILVGNYNLSSECQ